MLGFVPAVGLLVASACHRSATADIPVPRPEAYPRVQVYPSDSMVEAGGLPVRLLVNGYAPATITRRDRDNAWVNIRYPRYGFEIFVTVTTVGGDTARLAAVVDNRLERIGLNLGGSEARLDEFLSDDRNFEVRLVEAPGNPTPLQFLAVGRGGEVVSGSAAPTDPSVNPAAVDSLAPVVEDLRRDIMTTLRSLAPLSE
ncbi:MAG: hypothetical protein NC336_02685 [Clostridium sp.]|nr:hypothetical protein [Clostridium sp.]